MVDGVWFAREIDDYYSLYYSNSIIRVRRLFYTSRGTV